MQVFTGWSLRAQLLTVLGPRRAWRVAQLMAERQVPTVVADPSRRGFIKLGASVVAGVVGLAMLGPVPARVRAQDVTDATGTAATAAPVASLSVESESINRPGKYSRREGIESWDVERKPTGYKVEFKHEKRDRSGEVDVTYSDSGRSFTFVLKRDRNRFQLAFNSDRGTLAAVDANGRQAAGSIDGRRRRWDFDGRSEQVLGDSKKDFRLGAAIANDLAPSPRSRGRSLQAAAQQQCPDPNLLKGEAKAGSLSVACDWASINLTKACADYSVTCKDCCRELDTCDSFWIAEAIFNTGDFFCGCECSGYPHRYYSQSCE